MKRESFLSLVSPPFLALSIACGDTQGNVIERTANVTDGGGGIVGVCATLGGCAGAGGAATGGGANGGAGSGGARMGECSSNADCAGQSKNLCNQTLHTCAECVLDGDCVDGQETCSIALNRCAAPCSADIDCPPDDRWCDLALGRAGTPGYCVGCRSLSDCTDPERPYCVEGDCVACPNGQC
jgi:hypothetical protein